MMTVHIVPPYTFYTVHNNVSTQPSNIGKCPSQRFIYRYIRALTFHRLCQPMLTSLRDLDSAQQRSFIWAICTLYALVDNNFCKVHYNVINLVQRTQYYQYKRTCTPYTVRLVHFTRTVYTIMQTLMSFQLCLVSKLNIAFGTCLFSYNLFIYKSSYLLIHLSIYLSIY